MHKVAEEIIEHRIGSRSKIQVDAKKEGNARTSSFESHPSHIKIQEE